MTRKEYNNLYASIGTTIRNIISEKYTDGYRNFILVNGMALGVDQLFCEASILTKELFEPFEDISITVEAAVPCFGHGSRWPKTSQDKYERLISQCDKVTIVTEAPYSPAVMQKRNEYMVDKADVLIAVWDGLKGGTANCVKYAKKKNVQIIQIDPKKAGIGL